MADSIGDSSTRTFYFNLSFLGEIYKTADYTLKAFGGEYTLKLLPEGDDTSGFMATHSVEGVAVKNDQVQLIRVYGPEHENEIPSLAISALCTPNGEAKFGLEEVAKSILFIHPEISVLTPNHADIVLGHIGNTFSLEELKYAINDKKDEWNVPIVLNDEQGNPRLRSDGTKLFKYELDPLVLNMSAKPASEAKKFIYNDSSLEGVRWKMQPGAACIQAPVDEAEPSVEAGGYQYKLQDGGPHFGVKAEIVSVSEEREIEVKVTNNYIRHLSIFASFLDGKGDQMKVEPNIWMELLEAYAKAEYSSWYKELPDDDKDSTILGNETYKFLGMLGAEMTFMGVPVSSESQSFKFKMPFDQGSLSKIRILCGSLGVDSHNDADPDVAWIGLAMTLIIDMGVPTLSLVSGVGESTDTLFDSIFKDVTFLAPTALATFFVVKDIIDGSPNIGNDVKEFFLSLADKIVDKVLTTTTVAAELSAFFGGEAVAEAIPIAGWALKVLALEAAVEQLAQTVAEVVLSPRVVEFGITITMDAEITLKPDMSETPRAQPEFAETAHTYIITAQYSDLTAHEFNGNIADPKIPSITAHLQGIPVGGDVTFLIAVYSREGHLVGKGMTKKIPNQITEGKDALIASISVKEMLYPLNADTRYGHEHLSNFKDGSYSWEVVQDAPDATVRDLGTGSEGHLLEVLGDITLNADLGIVGYVWNASGIGIPSIDGGEETQLYAFQNLAYGAAADAGYMFTPKGYSQAPKLVYMRAMADGESRSAYFYVDPRRGEDNYYHLRSITPVTDSSIPLDDKRRLFDQSRLESWGRFDFLPISLAIHSNGYVVAVADEMPKLLILRLPEKGIQDKEAPVAQMVSGPGTRAGLLDDPILVAMIPDQTILVLERGNHRIQAFSRGGHPVEAFPNSKYKFWIELENPKETAVTYLAMTVEVKGYIYVHYYEGNGYEKEQFYLDIYSPEGNRIINQRGVNAAGVTVDLWRNLYALTYQASAGPKGRTEPLLSEWRPKTPATPPEIEDESELADKGWKKIETWRLYQDKLGYLTGYCHEMVPGPYCGGFSILGVGDAYSGPDAGTRSWSQWDLYTDFKDAKVALRSFNYWLGLYWNSRLVGDKGKAIYLWNDETRYWSKSLGADQEFQLVNLGKGYVAFKALAGRYKGKFLTVEKGGWYPEQSWSMGKGTPTFKTGQPKRGDYQSFKLHQGSQLTILRVTNSARECDLSGRNLKGLDVSNADFTSAILRKTKFVGIKSIKNADFTKAELNGAILDDVSLSDAKTFECADFSGTDLTKLQASPKAVLSGALFRAKANLSGLNLSGAKLDGADFSTAILDKTNLTGADLTGAIFTGASLKGTILKGASMHGAIFNKTDLTETIFDPKPDFNHDSVTKRTAFQGATIPYHVITDNWSYLDLTDATINDVPSTIESLNAKEAVLPLELDLSGKVLKEADFTGAQLYYAKLNGTNLYGAKFNSALLNGANLTGSNLSMADLTGAFLQGKDDIVGYKYKARAAIVTDAFLINAWLDGADCEGVNFSGSLFLSYDFYSTSRKASATQAKFNLTNFGGAVLTQVNFYKSHFAGSQMNQAIMVASKFHETEFTPISGTPNTYASFVEADIRGADYTSANMDGLSMLGAKVSTENGDYICDDYKDFDGNVVHLRMQYGATVQGETTPGTTCPDGSDGPCTF